jgi:hypothetical protein
LLLCSNAWGECILPHDINLGDCRSLQPPGLRECIYSVTSTTAGINESIVVYGTSNAAQALFINVMGGDVFWKIRGKLCASV